MRRWKAEDFTESLMEFDETSHTYTYSGVRMTSVTTWLKDRFVPKFNSDLHSQRIAEREGRSQESVLAEWKQKADMASYLGNTVHNYAERIAPAYHRGHGVLEVPKDDPRDHRVQGMQESVLRWFADRGGEFFGRWALPEVRVVDPMLRLAGMVDLLCCLNDEPAIVDWKTSAEIRCVGGDAMLSPLQDWYSCEFSHYTLQLNTYRYILKECYGYEATQMKIVHLGREGYVELDMPIVEDTIIKMLAKKPALP